MKFGEVVYLGKNHRLIKEDKTDLDPTTGYKFGFEVGWIR